MPRYIDAEKAAERLNACMSGKDYDKALAMQCIDDTQTADVVEIQKEAEWEMFELISSAYYGKEMYFMEDNGIVFSRYSHKYMRVDDAIREFVSLIDGTEEDDAEIH